MKISIKVLKIMGMSVLLMGLSACGFRPLYSDPVMLGQLTSMTIEAGDERVDYFLQRSMQNSFGSVEGTSPYRLVLESQSYSYGFGVSAADVASRFRYDLNIHYRLYDNRLGELILQGHTRNSAFYDAPASPYALYTARQDAEQRAANDAAQSLAQRLIAQVQHYERYGVATDQVMGLEEEGDESPSGDEAIEPQTEPDADMPPVETLQPSRSSSW